MVEMVQNIHQEETPLYVESIIEVVHRSWEVSVRPCPSKAPKGAQTHSELTDTAFCGLQSALELCSPLQC